jgi:hypothetical protein
MLMILIILLIVTSRFSYLVGDYFIKMRIGSELNNSCLISFITYANFIIEI